jgi:hypothetical protein
MKLIITIRGQNIEFLTFKQVVCMETNVVERINRQALYPLSSTAVLLQYTYPTYRNTPLSAKDAFLKRRAISGATMIYATGLSGMLIVVLFLTYE